MVACRVAGVVSVRHAGDALHAGARIERRGRFLVDGVACCGSGRAVSSSVEPPSCCASVDIGSRVAVRCVVQPDVALATKRWCDAHALFVFGQLVSRGC